MWFTGIKDPSNAKTAKVTSQGQLVTAPLSFSEIRYNALAVANTAYNFATPIANKAGVITDIIMATSKDIGPDGCLIEIYLTDSAISTTVITPILTVQISKNSTTILNNLNWEYKQGMWLNAKCSSTTAFLTICGYYIEV